MCCLPILSVRALVRVYVYLPLACFQHLPFTITAATEETAKQQQKNQQQASKHASMHASERAIKQASTHASQRQAASRKQQAASSSSSKRIQCSKYLRLQGFIEQTTFLRHCGGAKHHGLNGKLNTQHKQICRFPPPRLCCAAECVACPSSP